MALRFIDGFDHYAVGDVTLKWTSGSGSSMQTGRSGSGQAIRFNSQANIVKVFSAGQATWTIGMAMRFSFSPNGNRFIYFGSGSNPQVNIRMASNGQFQAFRNNTQIGDSGSYVFPSNSWQYVECKVFTNGSTGTVEMHVNGTQVMNLTGKNTDNAGSGTCDTISIGMLDFSNTINCDFDDFYAVDGTGSPNNTFLGDVAVQTLYPSAAGDLTQWTPSTGSNYQNVDETTINKDTDYNSTSTVGNEDLYAFTDLTGTIGSVIGVQKVVTVRKDDAGSRTVKSLVKSGGTVYEGTAASVGDNYFSLTEVLETDPATSSAWTETNVDAAQFGIKLES